MAECWTLNQFLPLPQPGCVLEQDTFTPQSPRVQALASPVFWLRLLAKVMSPLYPYLLSGI